MFSVRGCSGSEYPRSGTTPSLRRQRDWQGESDSPESAPCGALSGSILVLSQLVGVVSVSNIEDPENVRSKSYDLAQKLVMRF